jgi:hypothetical protein
VTGRALGSSSKGGSSPGCFALAQEKMRKKYTLNAVTGHLKLRSFFIIFPPNFSTSIFNYFELCEKDRAPV